MLMLKKIEYLFIFFWTVLQEKEQEKYKFPHKDMANHSGNQHYLKELVRINAVLLYIFKIIIK